MSWFTTIIHKAKIGLSNPKYRRRGDLYIESDDDLEADVIAECYKTRKPVMRSRHEV